MDLQDLYRSWACLASHPFFRCTYHMKHPSHGQVPSLRLFCHLALRSAGQALASPFFPDGLAPWPLSGPQPPRLLPEMDGQPVPPVQPSGAPLGSPARVGVLHLDVKLGVSGAHPAPAAPGRPATQPSWLQFPPPQPPPPRPSSSSACLSSPPGSALVLFGRQPCARYVGPSWS